METELNFGDEREPREFDVQVGTVFERRDGRGQDVILELLPESNAFQASPLKNTEEGVVTGVWGATGRANYIEKIIGIMDIEEIIEALKRGKKEWGQELSDKDIEKIRNEYHEGPIKIRDK